MKNIISWDLTMKNGDFMGFNHAKNCDFMGFNHEKWWFHGDLSMKNCGFMGFIHP